MHNIAIIDIDTTLANNDHRAAVLEQHCVECKHVHPPGYSKACLSCGHTKLSIPQEKWDQFLDPKLMLLDTPQPHAFDVLNHMRKSCRWNLVFMTGRNEKHRLVTQEWLKNNMAWRGSVYEPLIMRPFHATGIPASQMKEQLFLKYKWDRELDGYTKDSYFFFEDDKYVLSTWKKYGMVFVCPEAWEYMNPAILDREAEPSWSR